MDLRAADRPGHADATGGIADRHPAVATCVETTQDGKPVRTLSLKGGGTLIEQQTARDGKTVNNSCIILAGPLPVAAYRAVLGVSAVGKGSKLIWDGVFQPVGVDAAEARSVIEDIYETGPKGIAAKVR